MRKLASVQTVHAVEPIAGADAIERLQVLGWWVVGKKGEFRPGDRVVYCEIDSLLPEREPFEFLRKSCYRPPVLDARTGEALQPGGFRIKTVRLRGQISQGICFPLSLLPEPAEEGEDVSEVLGIRKYEPPAPVGMSGKVLGPFPGFLPKTDETRIQAVPGVLTRHRGRTFHLTEKEDGTSMTAFLNEGEFGLCGRNLRFDLSDESNGLVRLSRSLDLEGRLRGLAAREGIELALQGEAIGPGIQANKYALNAPRFRIFNAFDVRAHRYLDHARMVELVTAMGLETVPQLGALVLDHDVDALVELAIGASTLHPAAQREGLVLRPEREERDPELGRLSFKVISPKFLLKYDE